MDIQLIQSFIDDEGRLIALPAKQKKRVMALAYLAEQFEKDRVYTEKEVNEQINRCCVFQDSATVRRELYNHLFLNRLPDGSQYSLRM